MANRVFDFLLSGINSLVRLGKGGNLLESYTNSHIEFKGTTGSLLPVRTQNPIHLKDSVNLEFLRENVLLSYGTPVQNINELRSISEANRRDKQIRLVEDEQAFYQYDDQSTAIAPDPDNPNRIILPADRTLAVPGRWIKTKGRTQYHTDLIGNESGDDHPQYQLRGEKDVPLGYLGLASDGKLNATTDLLNEGSSNLYFTEERARQSSIEDQIVQFEREMGPSQNAVFEALETKEGVIDSGATNEFWDGSKTFREVQIQDIPGLEIGISSLSDQVGDLQENKENKILSGMAGQYFSHDKTFKQIDYTEIASTPDLSAIPQIQDDILDIQENKENRILSGSSGQFLAHDKVFRQIDYSQIANAPSGGTVRSRGGAFYTFLPAKATMNLLEGEYNNITQLISDIKLVNGRRVIYIEGDVSVNIADFDPGLSRFMSTLEIIGKARPPMFRPMLTLTGGSAGTTTDINGGFFARLEYLILLNNVQGTLRTLTVGGNTSIDIVNASINIGTFRTTAASNSVFHIRNSVISGKIIGGGIFNLYEGICFIGSNVFENGNFTVNLFANASTSNGSQTGIVGAQTLSGVTLNTISHRPPASPTDWNDITNKPNINGIEIEQPTMTNGANISLGTVFTFLFPSYGSGFYRIWRKDFPNVAYIEFYLQYNQTAPAQVSVTQASNFGFTDDSSSQLVLYATSGIPFLKNNSGANITLVCTRILNPA